MFVFSSRKNPHLLPRGGEFLVKEIIFAFLLSINKHVLQSKTERLWYISS